MMGGMSSIYRHRTPTQSVPNRGREPQERGPAALGTGGNSGVP